MSMGRDAVPMYCTLGGYLDLEYDHDDQLTIVTIESDVEEPEGAKRETRSGRSGRQSGVARVRLLGVLF